MIQNSKYSHRSFSFVLFMAVFCLIAGCQKKDDTEGWAAFARKRIIELEKSNEKLRQDNTKKYQQLDTLLQRVHNIADLQKKVHKLERINDVFLTHYQLSHKDKLIDNDWAIIPGKRVGSITKYTTEADLYYMFGLQNVKAGKLLLEEGEEKTGTIVYTDTPSKRLEIAWEEGYEGQRPAWVNIYGRKNPYWRIGKKVTIGTTLKELEKLNGRPFGIIGYGFHNSGMVVSNHKRGKLKWLGKKSPVKIWLSYSKYHEDVNYNDITKKIIKSNHPVMKKINPTISSISVIF